MVFHIPVENGCEMWWDLHQSDTYPHFLDGSSELLQLSHTWGATDSAGLRSGLPPGHSIRCFLYLHLFLYCAVDLVVLVLLLTFILWTTTLTLSFMIPWYTWEFTQVYHPYFTVDISLIIWHMTHFPSSFELWGGLRWSSGMAWLMNTDVNS